QPVTMSHGARNWSRRIARNLMLDPTCRVGKRSGITRGEARPGRIEGEICMFNWGKSSGVDAPRKKITFLAPAAFRGFLGVRGCAPEFPFFFSPPGIGPGLAATPFLSDTHV